MARERPQTGTRRLVLDDDPTGTQTVSGVEVILQPTFTAFERWLASGQPSAFVLTNTRALAETDAVKTVRQVRSSAQKAAAGAGAHVEFLLRGDSTLRGHVFAEIDALAEPDAVVLLVPAFPEGGRVTVDGVHYVEQDGRRVPVVDTEYARDPVFGYRSRRIADWVAEVGDGRRARVVPLAVLRGVGVHAMRDALREASPGDVIVPDAETTTDVELITAGLRQAQDGGSTVVVRGAATLAASWAGLRGRQLSRNDVRVETGARVLLVCGSYVEGSTRQLESLAACWSWPAVTLDTPAVLGPGAHIEVSRAADELRRELDRHRFAVLITQRVLHGPFPDIDAGARVMAGLVATVEAVSDEVDAVVVKGGITSADVARCAFHAQSAHVAGQLERGVPLWRLITGDGRRLAYAVVPGNVGDDRTLVRVAQMMGAPIAGGLK